jgi:hypothetical protein
MAILCPLYQPRIHDFGQALLVTCLFSVAFMTFNFHQKVANLNRIPPNTRYEEIYNTFDIV